MTDKKNGVEFDRSIEEIRKLIKFREVRERLTLLPNCYKISTEQKVASDTVIGRVEKIYAVADANGEIIAETITEFVQKAVSVADMKCSRAFLDLMEVVFDCEINIDKNPRFIDSKDGIGLKDDDYIFVPFEQLFLDGDIFPFRMDKEYKDVQKVQLFYYTFPKDLREYRGSSKFNFECFNKVQHAYNKILKKADRDDVYVPFYVSTKKSISKLTPILYLPEEESLLRALPVLYGATFAHSAYDRYAGICCKADEDLNDFCFYWRSIKQNPGACILHEWNELEEILKYSKFEKEGA